MSEGLRLSVMFYQSELRTKAGLVERLWYAAVAEEVMAIDGRSGCGQCP